MARCWQYLQVPVPAERTRVLIPEDVEAGGVRLEIGHECLGGEAVRGDGTRRFRVAWSCGGWQGRGVLDVRAHSSYAAQLVLGLDSPSGLLGSLAWPPAKLAAAAEHVGVELRRRIEETAPTGATLRMVS